jgi:hypothetical protein
VDHAVRRYQRMNTSPGPKLVFFTLVNGGRRLNK